MMMHAPDNMPSIAETAFRSRIGHFMQMQRHKKCEEMSYIYLLKESEMVGTRWRHYGNKNVYTITGFVWIGDLDEWCIQYIRPGMFLPFSRTISNSFADAIDHATGNPVRRFTLVQ